MASSKTPDTTLPPKLGYEDFWELPDDGNRYEIIDGKLYLTPAPATRHQIVSSRLEQALIHRAAKAGVGVSRSHRRHPGAASPGPAGRALHQPGEKQAHYVEGSCRAPDLAVEIVSPSSKKTDRSIKSDAYADSGISWYWIVDPDQRTVEEYQLAIGKYHLVQAWKETDVFEPKLFPGLSGPLEGLFDWSDFEGLEEA
jgi:Uma2 family endonuclease